MLAAWLGRQSEMCTGLFSPTSVSRCKIRVARSTTLIRSDSITWNICLIYNALTRFMNQHFATHQPAFIQDSVWRYKRCSHFLAELVTHQWHLAKVILLGLVMIDFFCCHFVFPPRWTAIIMAKLKDTPIRMSASALALVSGIKDIIHHLTEC